MCGAIAFGLFPRCFSTVRCWAIAKHCHHLLARAAGRRLPGQKRQGRLPGRLLALVHRLVARARHGHWLVGFPAGPVLATGPVFSVSCAAFRGCSLQHFLQMRLKNCGLHVQQAVHQLPMGHGQPNWARLQSEVQLRADDQVCEGSVGYKSRADELNKFQPNEVIVSL